MPLQGRAPPLFYHRYLCVQTGCLAAAGEECPSTGGRAGRAATSQFHSSVGTCFSNTPFANLADINQRMAFVLRAAKQFDDLLHSDQSEQIERSIRDIALGGGVR
ncbi:DUF2515 family protein [Pseudomonas sp. WJP1]|uniref:DUF2515 family protein n=1 Tax=Pseudomonas sp. WJP1 TaxID=2986947 RepID=UPI003FA78B3C